MIQVMQVSSISCWRWGGCATISRISAVIRSGCMIFGQSGGGAKCATLMAQPPAHGLFHRVVTMSGQQVTGAEPAHATERARAVLKQLGLDTAQPAETAQTLRTLPTETLQAATRAGGYYGPVKDGRSLPVDPFSPTDPKISAGVPMILGNTHDETRVLIGSGRPELFSLTWETLPEAIEKNAPFLKSPAVSLPVPEVIAKYREWHPDYTASDVFFAVTTDSRSWRWRSDRIGAARCGCRRRNRIRGCIK